MSRSNNTEIINPSKRFFEWVGSKGCLKYFDKSRGEKGENVFLDLPFTFLVLDRLATIKGFSDNDQSGFWSNEVRNIKTEPFIVKTKKGEVANGLYSTLANVLNQGACYCQSVYIAFFDENKVLQIGNFQIHGSAIGAWIEFSKKKNIFKSAISITGASKAKKGITEYYIPVYELKDVSESTEAEAIQLDKELQEYLKTYFNRSSPAPEISQEQTVTAQQKNDIEELQPIDEFDTFSSNDDLPF